MTQSTERRVVDIVDRLDQQDEVLRQVHKMTVEHLAMHKVTDPALLELIDILRGAKILKKGIVAFVIAGSSLWAFIEYVWTHIKFIRT